MPADRRWLVISYFSRIDGMACAQHIDDRVSILVEKGITPVMLTSVCGSRWASHEHARVPSVAPSGLRFELRYLRRRNKLLKFLAPLILILIFPFYLLEKCLVDLDSQWSWFPLAIIRGVRICRKEKPEIIYATGGASSAHLAAACISRFCAVPWVSEFQDPLVHGDWARSGRALKLISRLERLICAGARAVIFLTDAARDRAAARTDLGNRGYTVYPGADPAAMPDVLYRRGDACHFAHFGSFGGSRNLKVFLEGLRAAFTEDPRLIPLVRLDLYGTCDPLSRRLIERFPHSGTITDWGRVPRRESLVAMKRCDVLLLIQNTEQFSAETIPSKTYEYMHTGRPIMGLLYLNPELEEMLRLRGDLAVAADDPAQVQAGIVELMARWRQGLLSGAAVASRYTVSRAVDQIADLVQGTLKRERGLNR